MLICPDEERCTRHRNLPPRPQRHVERLGLCEWLLIWMRLGSLLSIAS